MTVVVLTNCPPKLRGDLTKWLLEINTNVFVGNISARVRDELWERICENVKSGSATMVFRADNEQRMDFRIHNTSWTPVDYDGIKLIMHTKGQAREESLKTALPDGFSKAARYRKSREIHKRKRPVLPSDYCVVDIETTGLDNAADQIIEIGALSINNDQVESEFQAFNSDVPSIPEEIVTLTGISENDLEKGKPLRQILKELKQFIGDRDLVFHNAAFDMAFLTRAFSDSGIPIFENRILDTMIISQKRLKSIQNHKLETLAEWAGIEKSKRHRALVDCYTTNGIYIKLKEI